MKAPALELGDIFRLHGPAYLTTFGASLSREQKQALRAIIVCRTAVLGGYVERCDQCGYQKISYCSCRIAIARSAVHEPERNGLNFRVVHSSVRGIRYAA